MSAQGYWSAGEGQQHNQRPTQQKGYGGANDNYGQNQYSQHQQNQADDPYGYLSSNQSNQPHGYEGHNSAPYQQPQYQSYTQQESFTQSKQYQYSQQPAQPYQGQPENGRYSPQPASYDQNYQQEPTAYPQHGYNSQPAPGQVADGDRGFLGAVGGAAAGGFAGHKINHGFLGTMGGAYAGHKLEDAMKDKKKKKDKDKQHGRRDSSSSSSSSDSSDDEEKKKRKYGAAAAVAGGGAYIHHQTPQQQQQHPRQAFIGNFSSSCTNITIDRDYDLIATCSTVGGHQKLSSISLNDHLTNEWGQLKWQRNGGFGGSARNVRLLDGGKVLEAELGDGRGGWTRSYVRLDERITNNDGELQFVG